MPVSLISDFLLSSHSLPEALKNLGQSWESTKSTWRMSWGVSLTASGPASKFLIILCWGSNLSSNSTRVLNSASTYFTQGKPIYSQHTVRGQLHYCSLWEEVQTPRD